MRYNRFFVPAGVLLGRVAKIIDPAVCKQISKVLRLREGEEIILLDGDGFEYVSRLTKITPREIQAEILNRRANKNEPELKITVYQALPKKDKFEWILQKCTEVGVAGFVPVLAERSEKMGFNAERARIIVREAAEQSERGILPEIGETQEFDAALRRVCRGDVATILLDSGGDPIKNFLPGQKLYALNIFVGPEGGWSEGELDRAREMMGAGCPLYIINIGSTVLRTETAGVVAAAILLNR